MNLGEVIQSPSKKSKKPKNVNATPDPVTINMAMTLGSDKGVIEVAAKVKRKQVGSENIEFHADPNWRDGNVVESDDE